VRACESAQPARVGAARRRGANDHAAYIANWLDVLKADNRAIFTAASHAQRAADFINGLQPPASPG
jgi:antirestriction protein ArdC